MDGLDAYLNSKSFIPKLDSIPAPGDEFSCSIFVEWSVFNS